MRAPANDVESFLERLFDLLKDQGLLVPVTLKGSKGGALPGLTGLRQRSTPGFRQPVPT